MVDVPKSRVECEAFIQAEAERAIFERTEQVTTPHTQVVVDGQK
jgi:hypothetical protein